MKFQFGVWLFLCISSRFNVSSGSEAGAAPHGFAPVIIVPGDGASPIDAKIKAKSNCDSRKEWFRMWLNVEDIMLGRFPCTAKNMMLNFNLTTNTSHVQPGVETQIPGWGTAHTVEYVDDHAFARIFHIAFDAAYLVQAMVSWGYTRDVSIRGAPYDFRFAMASQPEWCVRFKLLVEDTYVANNNRKVSIISHSMGGFFASWFLNKQSQIWKDKFIHSFIALSTPWGGSNKALQSITSGYNFNVPLVKVRDCKMIQRTFESNYLLMPNYLFHKPNHIFIKTPKYNFSLNPEDLDLYFEASNNKVGKLIYEKIMRENRLKRTKGGMLFEHPRVKTYCFYGVGLPTPGLFYYPKNFPDQQPVIQKVSGDFTLVHESLRGCKIWEEDFVKNNASDEKLFTEVHELPGVSHIGIFGDPRTQEKIKLILSDL
uniref:phospholipase A2 group XV-like n=1 Tax=Styela clava TaxID=7725 RepID=UPI00193ABC84|nr:phospholipase A2 group XV-like [Styela clava]